MFAAAQLVRNWSKQRPSNQGDLEYSVMGRVGQYHTGGGCTFYRLTGPRATTIQKLNIDILYRNLTEFL
jgi:hypothetical protein